jgi:hypothetical protein
MNTHVSPQGFQFNSTYPKGGVSYSKDSFVVNQTLVFQIKFCGKSPALRVAAKRYMQPLHSSNLKGQLSKGHLKHSQ